jgi:hypothetical protein
MARFSSSGPASIYCLCVRCREHRWHRGVGNGIVKCGKCGTTHDFYEIRAILPPRRKAVHEAKLGRLFV